MDLQTEKDLIKSEIDKVEDAHLVKAIKNMLAFGMSKKHEKGLYPMSKSAFYARNQESRKAIEENQLISQAEAKSYFIRKHGRE